MKRERLKKLLPVMQHYANGGEVEVRHPNHCWVSAMAPAWRDDSEYRIKPEPEYVPLEAEDWIKDGPWWVRGGEGDRQPVCVVRLMMDGIQFLSSEGSLNYLSFRSAMSLQRRNATSDWMPCKKLKQ